MNAVQERLPLEGDAKITGNREDSLVLVAGKLSGFLCSGS